MNYVKNTMRNETMEVIKKSQAAGDQVLQENLRKGTKIVPKGESKAR